MTVRTAGGHVLTAKGGGTIESSVKPQIVKSPGVLYVPDLSKNFLPSIELGRSGIASTWDGDTISMTQDGIEFACFQPQGSEQQLVILILHNGGDTV